ncbi:3-hydroxyacyl-CoA dehydrogenase [Calidifontimicrobium sp. SYSU G02091]|uniref:3-hydroxyacyl-CoA dehydrogenase n=1 Tax=Calidifontimicrobium sp. SYSU G02091 TaxID=2926421 RepID=UPI001F53D0EC|nr:3-hydroxyacyl-CoA dehydrogenase [Calidifontimicrobium sp. SYSU G02091]MCI1192847.1 3-hydroxyacyl-CoA dehydrogenase [Calidifontimicrobium sp. SYSU G02091]
MGIDLRGAPLLVVGAGIMGAGIAQVAAQCGHPVRLFDVRDGAAADARRKLAATLDGLVAKGKLAADAAQAALARIEPVASLDAAADAKLVVEAIVEDLEAKRALFRQLEALVAPDAVLATNTSSISVTAIAGGLAHPGRVVGMHFFNPVPLMKLVEVVSGLQTDAAVADAVFELAKLWGKVPVHATSTPGFIVNRIARPYYAETLALLHERAATPQVLDACLRAAGFRMGPCELMDLIGHDTNFAVTRSVYEANFYDKRYVPSLVQAEMVAGGLLGRKSGRGFYVYPDGAPALPVAAHEAPADSFKDTREVVVHGDGPIADTLEAAATKALAAQGWGPARERDSGWIGLAVDGARLMLTDGRTAAEVAAATGIADVALFDRPLVLPAPAGAALAYSVADRASAGWRAQAAAWLAALGFSPLPVADTPGLVVARTVAMLINEAADAVLQGVCTPDGADAAMKLGVNYPAGPFEWLARWDVRGVVALIDALDATYRGERYRVSPWLRRRALG